MTITVTSSLIQADPP